MQTKTTVFQNTQFCYRIGGQGPAVVLLHGFTESLRIWDDFARTLSQEFLVITPDLPGHGESGTIGEVHSMDLMAEAVKHILIEEGVDHCALIGHSMGGYISLAFAASFPGMVSGLGLFHSSALADTDEGKAKRDQVIEFVKKDHKGFISMFIPDLFAADNRKKYKKEIAELIEEAKKMSSQAIIAALRGMRDRADCRNILNKAGFPVLFIIGKLDSRVDARQAMEQAQLPDDTVVVWLGKAGHMGYIEEKEKTLYSIKVFLKGL